MERKKLTITIQQGENVSAVLTLPPDKKKHYRAGVIVAHGAGNDMDHEMLVDFSDGLARAGYPSLRFNFPYKEKGLKAPDGQIPEEPSLFHQNQRRLPERARFQRLRLFARCKRVRVRE